MENLCLTKEEVNDIVNKVAAAKGDDSIAIANYNKELPEFLVENEAFAELVARVSTAGIAAVLGRQSFSQVYGALTVAIATGRYIEEANAAKLATLSAQPEPVAA